MKLFRGFCEGNRAIIAGLAAAVMLLTGCTQPAAPVSSPYSAAPSSLPQLGSPDMGGNANRGGPAVVGAGSFPRSFLIPGTDTSIRIGG